MNCYRLNTYNRLKIITRGIELILQIYILMVLMSMKGNVIVPIVLDIVIVLIIEVSNSMYKDNLTIGKVFERVVDSVRGNSDESQSTLYHVTRPSFSTYKLYNNFIDGLYELKADDFNSVSLSKNLCDTKREYSHVLEVEYTHDGNLICQKYIVEVDLSNTVVDIKKDSCAHI